MATTTTTRIAATQRRRVLRLPDVDSIISYMAEDDSMGARFALPPTLPAGAIADGMRLFFGLGTQESWHPSAIQAYESIMTETQRRVQGVPLVDLNRGMAIVYGCTYIDGECYRVCLAHKEYEPMYRVEGGTLQIVHSGLFAVLVPTAVAISLPTIQLASCRRACITTSAGTWLTGTIEVSCAACGVHTARRRCSGCDMIYYCGAGCQKRHWKQHKRACTWWRDCTLWRW